MNTENRLQSEEYSSGKVDILSLYLPELEKLIRDFGEPSYRARQIYTWLHEKRVLSLEEMSNIPKSLKQKLSENCRIPRMELVKSRHSAQDGTCKAAFALEDGNIIESVFMPYRHGNSVCISSQAGCRMGCRFCASTLGGLARNLAASEMLGQVYAMEREGGQRVSHVVIMGTGEPLDNLEQVVRFIRILSDEAAGGISQRNITLSTCGLVPQIRLLAGEHLQVTLALSLHASNDELRRSLMPIANRYSIAECLDACEAYFRETGRRISYEYALIRGENDGPEQARELAGLLSGRNCHVNLIPVNPIEERDYRKSQPERVRDFQAELERHGINATVRRKMGADIDSACGQLRRKQMTETKKKGGDI